MHIFLENRQSAPVAQSDKLRKRCVPCVARVPANDASTHREFSDLHEDLSPGPVRIRPQQPVSPAAWFCEVHSLCTARPAGYPLNKPATSPVWDEVLPQKELWRGQRAVSTNELSVSVA